MAEDKAFTKLSELTDAELDTDKLLEAWKAVGEKFIKSEIASAIGYVATFWSAVEHVLFIVIKSIYRLDDVGMIVTIETSFSQRINIIRSGISLSRHQELFDEWCDIEKDLKRVQPYRNDLIHGMWLPREAEQVLARLTARGKYKLETSEYKVRDIQKIVVYIIRSLKKLSKFREKIAEVNLAELMKESPGPIDQSHSAKPKNNLRRQRTPKLSSATNRKIHEVEMRDDNEKI